MGKGGSSQYVYATGEGNFDGGGGGFGDGSNTNKWVNGDEGVRVTVVRATDGAAVSASVDLTNRSPSNIVINGHMYVIVRTKHCLQLSVRLREEVASPRLKDILLMNK